MKVWVTAIASFALGVACTFSALSTLKPEAANSVEVKTVDVATASTSSALSEWEGSSEGNQKNYSSINNNDAAPVMDCYIEKGQPSWIAKWNLPSCVRPLSQHHGNPLVSIVTAFDDGHLLSAIKLLQSLILAGYEGQLGVYLLLKQGQNFTERMKSLPAVVANTSIAQRTFFGTMESHDFSTYCFKSQVVQDYLYRTSENGLAGRPDVLIWADAHIRFKTKSISEGARMLLDENMHFVAPTSLMGMVESTHQATFDFLEVDPCPDYLNRIELCSCVFMVNMNVASAVREILNPWLHCGVNACRQCMTPIGTTKFFPPGKDYQGPGAKYLAHRQDQSVLGILAYEYELHHPNTTRLGNVARRYVHWTHHREERDDANNVEDLLDESWYVNKTI